MNAQLETLTQRQLSELETQALNLLATLRKTRLDHEALEEQLRQFVQVLGDLRRERYDRTHSDYTGY